MGSSPLTRGAPTLEVDAEVYGGLIPAHAGSTTDGLNTKTTPPAHPRSRGEHAFEPPEGYTGKGSSPLTRGARTLPVMRWLRRGLIPAHAGSTIGAPSQGSPPAAHPRSRGEHLLTASLARKVFGSSPLTRGARGCYSPSMPPVRLIPAHAGSTNFPLNSPQVGRAHPRSRGEHHIALVFCDPGAGSSPLTRGARRFRRRRARPRGLIPAHAGSTWRSRCRWGALWAHPRSRGEHRTMPINHLPPRGSSPLTRGAHVIPGVPAPVARLIPAHAGSTDAEGLRPFVD